MRQSLFFSGLFLLCFVVLTSGILSAFERSAEKIKEQYILSETRSFDGGLKSGWEIPIRGSWTYWEFEFDVYPDLDACPKTFMPILNTKDWLAGSFHCELTGRDLALIIHLGAGDRCRLNYRNIPYKTWSRVRFVVNLENQQAELFVNGKSLDRQSITIPSLDLTGLLVGYDTDSGLAKPRFKGQLKNLAIRGKRLVTLADQDCRYIQNGFEIPRESYCDQPYVVVLKDGTWVCVETTASGREGSRGQHIVAMQSQDQGKTWSPMVDIEPSGELSASWVVPLRTDFDRIYAFYTYNGDAVRLGRDDTHGWYAYKYSDDGGKTWSDRYRIPIRQTRCDKLVQDGQVVQMFWGICKPQIVGTDVYFSFTKLGKYFLENGEGWVVHSKNILTERDPGKIEWELLPEGNDGILNPDFGSVQEEHNIVPLNAPGGFFCVYRTTRGFPATSYSRDGGKSWSVPEPMVNAWGKPMFNPRACPKVWKCRNGKYLFWFHNNFETSFTGRNPAWLAAGIERDGKILWSEPEIVLFDLDRKVGMSYPDLVEDGGQYWITETQKTVGRVHPLDRDWLNSMWLALENKLDGKPTAPKTPGFNVQTKEAAQKLSEVGKTKGFAFDCFLTKRTNGETPRFKAGDVLYDNKTLSGDGVTLSVGIEGRLVFNAKCGSCSYSWMSGEHAADSIASRVSISADFAVGILTVAVDGHLSEPGTDQTRGWVRIANPPENLTGRGDFAVHPEVRELDFYDRPLAAWESL